MKNKNLFPKFMQHDMLGMLVRFTDPSTCEVVDKGLSCTFVVGDELRNQSMDDYTYVSEERVK